MSKQSQQQTIEQLLYLQQQVLIQEKLCQQAYQQSMQSLLQPNFYYFNQPFISQAAYFYPTQPLVYYNNYFGNALSFNSPPSQIDFQSILSCNISYSNSYPQTPYDPSMKFNQGVYEYKEQQEPTRINKNVFEKEIAIQDQEIIPQESKTVSDQNDQKNDQVIQASQIASMSEANSDHSDQLSHLDIFEGDYATCSEVEDEKINDTEISDKGYENKEFNEEERCNSSELLNRVNSKDNQILPNIHDVVGEYLNSDPTEFVTTGRELIGYLPKDLLQILDDPELLDKSGESDESEESIYLGSFGSSSQIHTAHPSPAESSKSPLDGLIDVVIENIEEKQAEDDCSNDCPDYFEEKIDNTNISIESSDSMEIELFGSISGSYDDSV